MVYDVSQYRDALCGGGTVRSIVVISIVGFLLVVFWVFRTWISANIAVIGTLATSLAFFAALWSAFEARNSANAAFLAVKTAEASLEEARQNFRKEAYNQRFSLLLEQHNVYLEKINKFVASDQGWTFVDQIFKTKRHHEAFERLRGHFICSPYMRVLYHLLKFINDDYYGNKNDIQGLKKYSSLVRSLISNDILFLIAVNSSYINDGGSLNQYDKYQKYLQRFDFFEHADFSILHHPENTKVYVEDTKPLAEVQSDFFGKLRRYAISDDRNALDDYTPDISLSVILSYIYKSPNQKETEKWFDEVSDMIKQGVDLIKSEVKSDEHVWDVYLKHFLGTCKTETLHQDCRPKELVGSQFLDKSIISDFIMCYKNGNLHQSPNPAFYLYKYSDEYKDYFFEGDSNFLIERINDYLSKVEFNNDFIHEEIYRPEIIQVLNALESAKMRMYEQRHTDG